MSQRAAKEDCNARYVATLNKAAQSRNDSLPGVCCGYRYWEDCTRTLATKECGASGVEALDFLVKKAFLEVPELTCPRDLFPLGSEECRSALAPKGKKVKLAANEGVGKFNVAHVFAFMFKTE